MHCKNGNQNFKREKNYACQIVIDAQYAKIKFSSKSKARNKTYPGLISMLQGFQKCIA